MKNLKTIITVIAISLSTVFSVTATEKNPSETAKKELRSSIVSIIGKTIPLDIKKNCKAEISFMVNQQNELVIISVDSKVKDFNSFVKNKLNYKKVNVKGVKKGEVYKMPIKINKNI
ncbi:MAG: hypothetical protein AB8B78_10285 [Polaribacter sp.]